MLQGPHGRGSHWILNIDVQLYLAFVIISPVCSSDNMVLVVVAAAALAVAVFLLMMLCIAVAVLIVITTLLSLRDAANLAAQLSFGLRR